MTPPEITQHDRNNLSALHGSTSVPVNRRDASNTAVWVRKPTVIATPSDNNRFLSTKQPSSESRRSNGNPYVYTNNLSSRKPRPGNPNIGQTLLSKYSSDNSSPPQSRELKRQRLDPSALAGSAHGIKSASSPHARGIGPGSVPKLGIQTFNSPNPVSNDAEIIILDDSEDVGEPVSRAAKSSSPDPLLLTRERLHDFETLPNPGLPTRSTGKGRAISPEVVPDSEVEDDIEEFDPPQRRLPDAKTPGEIPKNIVNDRKNAYEKPPLPAAVRRPLHPGVRSIHLLDPPSYGGTVSRMKGKNQHPPRAQGGTSTDDPIGTSSSYFKNSTREKEGTFSFPLEAWCFGHHHIQHTEDDPLTLNYDRKSTSMEIVSGKRQRGVMFKIDRNVDSVKIVSDDDEPLKNNVLIQFTTVRGKEWKKYEDKLNGFQAGAARHKGHLTFLFSTAKERGFSLSKYQEFVALIKKQVAPVEIMRPTAGGACWNEAFRYAEMRDAHDSSRRNDATEDDRTSRTRGTTPSSTSDRSQISRPGTNPLNGDMVPPTRLRRSVRQSESHIVESSPPPLPPPPSEPDEVVLMYPPTGTGALSIMRSDLKRLGPEEYLNDTLIEFGLKLWLNDLRRKDPTLADQIHVFSSFFYKKLNNKKHPEEGYQSVRKWTSKVDLFSKKYVIVPINENIHWYLAIIYEPRHTLEPPLPPSQPPSARVTRKRKQGQEQSEADIEVLPPIKPMDVSPEEPDPSRAETATEPSSINATCSSIPHIIEDTEMGDATITTFERSCSISASKPLSTTSSKGRARDSSPLPDLYLPASDAMEIDMDGSVTKVPQKQAKAEIPEPSISKSQSAIPVNRFYALASREGIEPAEAPSVITEETEDQQQEAEVDDMLAVPQPSSPNSPPQTYIFTLDSLGTRHPQAIKVLKNYLAAEAKDKHNFDQVRDPIGKQVQVPVQPNTWDCGIYLIHFVKVFMSSPAEFLEQILNTRGTIPSSERKKRWQDHEIPLFRDSLLARISELSDEWKAVREVEAKNKEPEDLSSEGEVDIVDVVGESPNGRVAGRKRRAPRPSGGGDVDIEEVPSGKAAPAAREKQPARRTRG